MAPEGKCKIDPQVRQILTRLKQTAQRIEQEYQEKERCVRCAEEILRKVSVRPL
jgi:hypothetical protein